MTLAEILKDSNYKLNQFSADKIQTLETNIIVKQINEKSVPSIKNYLTIIILNNSLFLQNI